MVLFNAILREERTAYVTYKFGIPNTKVRLPAASAFLFLARIEFRVLRRRVTKHARVQEPRVTRAWIRTWLGSSNPESSTEASRLRVRPQRLSGIPNHRVTDTPDTPNTVDVNIYPLRKAEFARNPRDKSQIPHRLVIIENFISNRISIIRALDRNREISRRICKRANQDMINSISGERLAIYKMDG